MKKIRQISRKIFENSNSPLDLSREKLYNTIVKRNSLEDTIMKHIETIETRNLCDSAKNGGCGECQTSCQSACKTSCGIANQECENKETK